MNNQTFPKMMIYNCMNGVLFSTYSMVALSMNTGNKEYAIQFATSELFSGVGEA